MWASQPSQCPWPHAVTTTVAAVAVVAAGSSKEAGSVAVLLPDSKSSVRWETVDRPFLKEAFDAAGVKNTIQNAEGDKSTQQQQASRRSRTARRCCCS